MFRYLEINVKGSMDICGENLGMIIPSTNLGSELKNKHVAISYHKLRESAAASIVNPIKVCTTVNRADIFTEGVPVGNMGSLSDTSYVVGWGES